MKAIQFLKCGSIALLLFGFPLLRAAPGEFFVAADGNDAWSGRLAKATPDASDGPLASFAAAKDRVRMELARGGDKGVTVTFSAGRYELAAPLEFDPADSGVSTAHPVIYQSAPGAEVEISGGRRIGGWEVI